jgi:hypothetical protein
MALIYVTHSEKKNLLDAAFGRARISRCNRSDSSRRQLRRDGLFEPALVTRKARYRFTVSLLDFSGH